MVSRQLIQHVSAYPVTIVLLALATFCSTFGSSLYLQRVHGWDRTSAFLAGSPGALSQITILAVERGADLPAIAVVQTMRVIILTAALPLVLALTGVAPASSPGTYADGCLAARPRRAGRAALAVALLLRLIKFPASWMFGAMIASSVLHGAGLVDGGLPPWVRGVALVGIGALIGSRFARMRPKMLLGHINAALGSFAIAIAISGLFVAVIALTTQVRLVRHRRRLRAGRDGRHAGAGADPAHRSDLRRRASSVALRLRHHRHARHRPSVRTDAGRRRRLAAVASIDLIESEPNENALRALGGPGDAPGRDRGHQQRDQHVVAGERQAEEAPLHLVAADHFHRVEPLQQIAGAAEIADRPGAIGRPLPKPPFDAGVIGAEPGIAERRQREDGKAQEQQRRGAPLAAANATSAASGTAG